MQSSLHTDLLVFLVGYSSGAAGTILAGLGERVGGAGEGIGVLVVFGDAFGDECERSVRRLFGGRVVRYHMAFLGYIRGRCLIIVSLRVCSGPQQIRNVAWIIALAEISSVLDSMSPLLPPKNSLCISIVEYSHCFGTFQGSLPPVLQLKLYPLSLRAFICPRFNTFSFPLRSSDEWTLAAL